CVALQVRPQCILVAGPRARLSHRFERLFAGWRDADPVDEADQIVLRPPTVLAHDPLVRPGHVPTDQVVAPLRRAPGALWSEAAPENRNALLDRLHDPAHTRKLVVLADVIEDLLLAVQAAFEDVDDLPGAADALLGVDAERLELLPLRTDADTQVEAAL